MPYQVEAPPSPLGTILSGALGVYQYIQKEKKAKADAAEQAKRDALAAQLGQSEIARNDADTAATTESTKRATAVDAPETPLTPKQQIDPKFDPKHAASSYMGMAQHLHNQANILRQSQSADAQAHANDLDKMAQEYVVKATTIMTTDATTQRDMDLERARAGDQSKLESQRQQGRVQLRHMPQARAPGAPRSGRRGPNGGAEDYNYEDDARSQLDDFAAGGHSPQDILKAGRNAASRAPDPRTAHSVQSYAEGLARQAAAVIQRKPF
jgi:hypothetical protein